MTRADFSLSDRLRLRMRVATVCEGRPVWLLEAFAGRPPMPLPAVAVGASDIRDLIAYLRGKLQVLETAASEDVYTQNLPLEEADHDSRRFA